MDWVSCQSFDLPPLDSPDGDERRILYSNCDEGGDCPASEVCGAAGGTYYACRRPLDCDGPTFRPGCDYACRGDAECPPAAPRCHLNNTDDACSEVGFCGAA